jgi:hypothetical protein
MDRCVEPEILDDLPPADPRAAWSRQDLVRLNAWMGSARIMAGALRAACPGRRARRVVELGAGDGRFLLRVARRLSPDWEGSSAVLLDRQHVVSPETRRGYETLDWHAETVTLDVFQWLRTAATSPAAMESKARSAEWQPELGVPICDAIVANLFLHHFSAPQLAGLLSGVARRAEAFIALEPRRSRWALEVSRILWVIGCNGVTRHDAPISVRAGFAGRELSRLWPAAEGWSLAERPAGWFSHLFVAQRHE